MAVNIIPTNGQGTVGAGLMEAGAVVDTPAVVAAPTVDTSTVDGEGLMQQIGGASNMASAEFDRVVVGVADKVGEVTSPDGVGLANATERGFDTNYLENTQGAVERKNSSISSAAQHLISLESKMGDGKINDETRIGAWLDNVKKVRAYVAWKYPEMLKDASGETFARAALGLGASRRDFEESAWEADKHTNEDTSEYGVELLGKFTYNTPMMVHLTSSILDAPHSVQLAFVSMLDQYHQDLPMFSWDGAWRMIRGVVSDPYTYVGVGVGIQAFKLLVGKNATVKIAKSLLKSSLRKKVAAATVVAAEAAVYEGGFNVNEQRVRMAADPERDFSLTELAITGTVAAGAGLTIFGTLGAIGGKAALGWFLHKAGRAVSGKLLPRHLTPSKGPPYADAVDVPERQFDRFGPVSRDRAAIAMQMRELKQRVELGLDWFGDRALVAEATRRFGAR